MARKAGLVVGMLLLAHSAAAQFTQQGSKLVGPALSRPPGTLRQVWQRARNSDE